MKMTVGFAIFILVTLFSFPLFSQSQNDLEESERIFEKIANVRKWNHH